MSSARRWYANEMASNDVVISACDYDRLTVDFDAYRWAMDVLLDKIELDLKQGFGGSALDAIRKYREEISNAK